MKPYPHQIKLANQAYPIIDKHNIVYLACEERTGKSITSLLIFEKLERVSKILVITKKVPLKDWGETIKACTWLTKDYDIVNYHQVKTKSGADYDGIILDEAHCYISGYPKPSLTQKQVKEVCKKKPIVYLSATPFASGIQLLYHQLDVSSYSVWKHYYNFYEWYTRYAKRDEFGQVEFMWVHGRQVRTYKSVNYDKAYNEVKHLFVTATRKEIGFNKEPTDKLHYIELSANTKTAYNTLLRKRVLEFNLNNKDYTLVADTQMKLTTSLHMLEGGAAIVDNQHLVLTAQEKIDYIKKVWGDNDNIAIMYHYIPEGVKLREVFKKAIILQGISYAEGVSLAHIDTLIIYSQNFSTSKHTQRRARQASKERLKDIEVHFLLVKKAVSDQVYRTVSINKRNYIDSLFESNLL